jgi:hypothetical protein
LEEFVHHIGISLWRLGVPTGVVAQPAKLEIIDNAGHAGCIDQPQRCRALLAEFVQRR